MSKVVSDRRKRLLGTQVIAALLHQGREVRATVAHTQLGARDREALRHGRRDDNGLEVVIADLTATTAGHGYSGVEEVHHIASPIPPAQPRDPETLIVPARGAAASAGPPARPARAAWC